MSLSVLLPLLAVLLATCTLQAQNFPETSSSIASAMLPEVERPTIVKRVDEVNLLLSVTNHRGGFVRDLSQDDLVISDNGEPPAKITYFQSQTDLPLRVAVAIDTSDSVASRFRFERKSASAFLKNILRPQEDNALIVGFNEYPRLAQGSTSDLSALNHGIQGLLVGGTTAVFDAVAFASDQLRALPDTEPVRRIIVLITDGVDNRSHFTLDQAVEHALLAEAVLYVVNTQEMTITDEDKFGKHVIQQLAETTGGAVLSGASENEISESFRKIQAQLRSQYALGYRPRNILSEFRFRPIRVLGPKGIRIRCRLGYYAR